MHWRFPLLILTVCPAVAAAAAAPAPVGPPGRSGNPAVVERAEKLLYTSRSEAIRILEDAVEADPHDVACWAALVRALDVDNLDGFADRAARTALDLNPGDPTLLVARARALPPAPALDVLAELARVPGQDQLAERLSEIVGLGIGVPTTWTHDTYAGWARLLLYAGRDARAMAVLDEGLGAHPHEPRLLAYKALAMAAAGELDKAMALQAASGFEQVQVETRWAGIADCLLARGRADLAVRSFGGKAPPADGLRFDRADQRRLLAYASAGGGRGEPEAVRDLLDFNEQLDRLLWLRILQEHGRDAEAERMCREIVGPLEEFHQGSRGGPLLRGFTGATSLRPVYVAAVRSLLAQFPARAGAIEREFGKADQEAAPYRPHDVDFVPASRRIAELRRDVAAAPAGAKAREARRRLARALADARRHDEAADAIAPNALEPPATETTDPFPSDAWRWGVYAREADAEALHQSDPKRLARARRLLHAMNVGLRERGTNQKVGVAPEDVAAVASVGPGVLAEVYAQGVQPNTISGEDRSPYVEVVRRVGDARDTPVLIQTLALVAHSVEDRGRRPAQPGGDRRAANDLATERAILACLEHLTGVNTPAGTARERVDFWKGWWSKNARALCQPPA